MKRRLAHLPLHGGKAPAWLFQRMQRLAGAITMAIVDAYGPDEMLRRLADPWWFQAFGCVLGFDWHSSGLTTVTCGALKEASRKLGDDLGIIVAGGKGQVSRKTPQEIAAAADRQAIAGGDKLIYASRMSAKVDSAAVQDGYQIYHHTFCFTPSGGWCVVQQGMNADHGWARRYHWLGESVDDFVCEPHAGIQNLAESDSAGNGAQSASTKSRPRQLLLNMVADEAAENRSGSAALVRENPDYILAQIEQFTEGPTLFAPARHRVLEADINPRRLRKVLIAAHEQHPRDFETLLGTAGVGPATIRSLSLLAELVYQAPASHRDPAVSPPSAEGRGGRTGDREIAEPRRWADYSYTHGGKDGTPFPVDRETYDRNIAVLSEAVRRARLGESDKIEALRRLAHSESSSSASDV
jgi:hypothetical protein